MNFIFSFFTQYHIRIHTMDICVYHVKTSICETYLYSSLYYSAFSLLLKTQKSDGYYRKMYITLRVWKTVCTKVGTSVGPQH